MDFRTDEAFRQRESKLLEWVFSDRNSLKSTDAVRHIRDGFARRLLLMQASRRAVSQVLSPSRRRRLSLDECADLNVHLNSLYTQLLSALDNLARTLQCEFAIAPSGDEGDATVCDLFGPDFQRCLTGAFPDLLRSLESHMLWAMELQEYRDPRRQSTPLYVVPGLADEDDVAALRDLESELTAAVESDDFATYRAKLSNVPQIGMYLPLLATPGLGEMQLRPLPDQLCEDEGKFLDIAEAVFSALGAA